MGCTVGRTPGDFTAKRGRGVLGLGGLRACEGVRGRVRACFTLTQIFQQPSTLVFLNNLIISHIIFKANAVAFVQKLYFCIFISVRNPKWIRLSFKRSTSDNFHNS